MLFFIFKKLQSKKVIKVEKKDLPEVRDQEGVLAQRRAGKVSKCSCLHLPHRNCLCQCILTRKFLNAKNAHTFLAGCWELNVWKVQMELESTISMLQIKS